MSNSVWSMNEFKTNMKDPSHNRLHHYSLQKAYFVTVHRNVRVSVINKH